MTFEQLTNQDAPVPWQALYTTLVESTGTSAFVCDPTGRLVAASPRFCELVGEPTEQMLKHSISSLFPSTDLFHLVTTSDPLRAHTCRMSGPNGRWIEIKVDIYRLAQGWLFGKVDENSIVQASLAAQAAIEHAPLSIFRLDDDAVIIEANDAACRSLGYSLQELIGKKLFDISPRFPQDKWRQHRQNLASEGTRTIEAVHQRKDGSTFPVEITINFYSLQGKNYSYSFARDLSTNRRTEEALKQSENRFHVLADASFEGIALTRRGVFLDFNDQFARMFGYSREELINRPIIGCVAPEHRQMVTAFVLSGREEPYEHLAVRNDGSTFPVEIHSRITRINDQEVRLTAIRDITERKQAEANLRESELLLRKSQSVGQIGSYSFDARTGNWISTLTLDELFGIDEHYPKNTQGWIGLIHPDDQADMLSYFSQYVLAEHHAFDREYRIIRSSNQQVRWLYGRGELEYDENGQTTKMIGTIQDITERKRNEILLQTLNTAATAMQKANAPRQIYTAVTVELEKIGTSCAFFTFDAQKENLLLTQLSLKSIKRAEKLTGLNAATFSLPINKVDLFRKAVTERKSIYIPTLEEPTRQALNRPLAKMARLVIKYLGVSRSIIAPLIVDDQVTGLFAVLSHDLRENDTPAVTAFAHQIAAAWRKAQLFEQAQQEIIARREAEAQVRQLNEELEERVADRTAQLRSANAELEAFAYSVSHDLRAPLRAINGYTEILVEDHGAALDEEGKRVCAVISTEAQRMGQLIDDLLAFSRLGRAEMQIFSVDMNALVRTIFNELTTPTEKKRIQFQLDFLPEAAADPVLIRQVWVNLLANAIKFSRNCSQACIHVGSTLSPGEVTFWVKDNGAGFDKRYADKLFGVFQRLHSEKEFEGTGVGLAIVKRVVNRHGGQVWADSTAGLGASFFFTLPRKEPK